MIVRRNRKPYLLPTRKATGHKDRQLRQITLGFDEDLFSRIAARAHRERTSFAEQVRTFCDWGLDEVEEAEE